MVSIAYTRRGTDLSFGSRSRQAWRRAPALAPAASLFLLLAVGAGAWYYYNAHVLNEYMTAEDRRHALADYERQFKKYEDLPQPKVTAVDTRINIYPERRSFDGTGRFTLQNKSALPMSEIHLTDQLEAVGNVKFDRPFHLVSRSARNLYTIYAFDQPLAPGEVVTLSFSVGHETRGFRDGNEPAQFAFNGTFFDSEYFPGIGYDPTVEIDDPRRWREEHLGALEEMAPRGDPLHSRINLFSKNADWITYHTILSTSADQIGIAPGVPARARDKDGRHYSEYSMGPTHILDFYAYLSGRYAVRKEIYSGPNGPVNLEVYYDSAHPYNVEEMLAASRAGLDYLQAHFSP